LDEPGDLLHGDNFDPGDLLIALEGEDIFLVPQSRSESRSVGKDDSLLVPQSRDVFKSPQGCSFSFSVAGPQHIAPRLQRRHPHPVGKDGNSRPSAAHLACAIDQVGSLIEWL
jgi:hypothetical protein